jgi:hypothetical protein
MTGVDIQKTGLERNCCKESIQRMSKVIETPRNDRSLHSKDGFGTQFSPKRAFNGFAKERIHMVRAVEYIGREIGRAFRV